MEPGKSKNDILLTTTHDIEEMLLSDSFDVHVESACVPNYTSFFSSLVHVTDHNGRDEFFYGELVFPDKLLVDARDVGTYHIHKIVLSATLDLCSHIHQLQSTFTQLAVRTLWTSLYILLHYVPCTFDPSGLQ